VDHHKKRTREFRGQTFYYFGDRFDTAGGPAYDHDVPPIHLRSDAEEKSYRQWE
jgi:hypothetical protein